MFKVAQREWGLAVDNPLQGLDLPPEDYHREPKLGPEERFQLYRAIEGCRGIQQQRLWLSLVIIALNTALRRGELLKLEWRDIDLSKGTMNVRAENTKTRKSRLLPLSGQAKRALQQYYETISEEGRAPAMKVFPITGSAHEQAWRRICRRAGIRDLHFHDLRHIAATAFASKPVDLSVRENAYMLGHISAGVTGRYENHEKLQMVEAIKAKLDAADTAFYTFDQNGNALHGGIPLENVAMLRTFMFKSEEWKRNAETSMYTEVIRLVRQVEEGTLPIEEASVMLSEIKEKYKVGSTLEWTLPSDNFKFLEKAGKVVLVKTGSAKR